MPSIVWFRQDLRLSDHAALAAAAAEGPVLPVYILDEASYGAAQAWWLHHSLTALARDLGARGLPLVLQRGNAADTLARLAEETGIRRIHGLHHYEPYWREAERRLSRTTDLVLHQGTRLFPLEWLQTGTGGRYRIFTPFWRALLAHMPPPPAIAAPATIVAYPLPANAPPPSAVLRDWALLPSAPDWSAGFADWTPGEAGAQAALDAFLPHVASYAQARNFPSRAGVSRLSPHLHFGEISPAQIWHATSAAAGPRAQSFLRELIWRDYAANIIDIRPDYGVVNGSPALDALRWRVGDAADRDFTAWTRGRTGYPIVDAGMRELWTTGWMHNRVRMIAASFLIKHLLIDWRRGAAWFRETLLDFDHPNNAVNWQWVAGTGADASMFVRIMAPLLQSEKFDAGAYIRRWVPELAALPDPMIHDPETAGLLAPRGYPAKLIGHREARERALAAAAEARGAAL